MAGEKRANLYHDYYNKTGKLMYSAEELYKFFPDTKFVTKTKEKLVSPIKH